MRKTTRRALALALALLFCLCAAAEASTMYVSQATKLYKKNKASSKVLATVAEGEEVDLLATKGNWAKVRYGSLTGFMKKAALSDNAPEAEEPDIIDEDEDTGEARTMYAQAQLKLFKAKKTSAKVLCKVPRGAAVSVYAISGKWAKASYNGKTGFLLKAGLSDDAPDGDDPEPDTAPAPSDEYPTLKPGDTGEAVKTLQRRLKELEWFYGEIGGNYKTLTTQAVRDFQEAVGLPVNGIADGATQRALHSNDAPRNVINSTATPASGKSKEMDWWTSGIQEIFARGSTATVTDVETKLSWKVVRSGGTNHADVQPKTSQDTALMKKAYGGNWSWNRRAIWVSIGGKKYAASMNGMPHGSGSITDNDFDGHHCIHFTNSRTHGSNSICSLHQAAIQKALAAG